MTDNNEIIKKDELKLTKEKGKKTKKSEIKNGTLDNEKRCEKIMIGFMKLRNEAKTNDAVRDNLLSVFDEIISSENPNISIIKKFNSLDAGTKNMIYHNKGLMVKVLGDMFNMNGGEGQNEEKNMQVNEFLKNLEVDLNNNEYSLINHPENDDVLDEIIKEFDENIDKLDEDNKKLFETIKRLMDQQKIKRELLRNNLYYKKPEVITTQENEQKSRIPTLEQFIDTAKSEDDIKQVEKMVLEEVKFENYSDLNVIVDKFVNKKDELIDKENEKSPLRMGEEKVALLAEYINNLDSEELKYFVDNTLVDNGGNLVEDKKKENEKKKDKSEKNKIIKDKEEFIWIVTSQTGKNSEEVEKNIVSCLMANPDVYKELKGDDYVVSLVEKYRDAQLTNYENRTVTEELALLGEEKSIKELEDKIKNGGELTESMKNMLYIYSDKNDKNTKDNRKTLKNKLDNQKKEIEQNITSNNNEISKINSDIKNKEKNIKENEKKLEKKQEELYTNYNKDKVSFIQKRNFNKKREELRGEIDILREQIKTDKEYVLNKERNKKQLKMSNIQLENKKQQIKEYGSNKDNVKQLGELYKLNNSIESFKQNTKELSFSDVIELLETENDINIKIAILNSYCKEVSKLNNKEFNELLGLCIKIDDSVEMGGGVKKPLNVLLEKDSLAKCDNEKIYSLLHNEELGDERKQNILGNLSDNKLSATMSMMIEKINDNSEIEDEKKGKLADAEKEQNLKIINSYDKDKVKKLQEDGKFQSLRTLIDYAKDGLGGEERDENKIGLLNNIVDGLEIQKISDNESQENIEKQKQINKETINILKDLCKIYKDNEQGEGKIIDKLINSIGSLTDSPELIDDIIDFTYGLYDKGGKTEEEKKQKIGEIKGKISEQLMNTLKMTDKPTEKELVTIENNLKALYKLTKNNNYGDDDNDKNIKENMVKTIKELIDRDQIDIVLNVIGSSSDLIQFLDDDNNDLVDSIYNGVKNRELINKSDVKNTHLTKTLIQLYNLYNEKGNKVKDKEDILNKILSLSDTSIITCMQYNDICDNLLLKIVEKKPEILDQIKPEEKNKKIIEQVGRILNNEDIVKDLPKTKEELQRFKDNYYKQQEELEQQKKIEQEKKLEQEKENKNGKDNEQELEQKKSEQKEEKRQENVLVEFFNDPIKFMDEASENPVKLMELMMAINAFCGNANYPLYQQDKMDEESYEKYVKNPDEFMNEFIKNPMKFVGMIGQSADKLGECFNTYLNKHDGKYPDEFGMALIGVTSYLNNTNQPTMYQSGYGAQCGVQYGVQYGIPVGQVGNIVVPNNFNAMLLKQMRYEQECLQAINERNKIAKEELELKKQKIAEMKRANDIKESESIMNNVFSKIKSEDLNDGSKEVIVTYSGPSGEKKQAVTISVNNK